MTQAENMLTPDQAKEVKLSLLPWRRRAQIREYAGQLALPEVEGLQRVPKTRLGLVQLANDRLYHDGSAQFHGRIEELEENGLDHGVAAITAIREMTGREDPTQQPTLFDKE